MPYNTKQKRSEYNEMYYRENKSKRKKQLLDYYHANADEINAKRRAKYKEKKEQQRKEDRANGVWDF